MASSDRAAREQSIYDSLVYPDSDVLRNKLDITDQDELDRAEADVVAICEPTRPRFKTFSLMEMQTVHRHLLSDVYEWAGQLRTYTTGRNQASFARPEFIASYFDLAVFRPLQHEDYLQALDPAQFADRSAYYASEINAVHPFIDGNGRTTRLWLQDLALQAGYRLDIVRLQGHKGAWYAAMKAAFESAETDLLAREILHALDRVV